VDVQFTVEHAGCESCAERVRTALSPFGDVRDLEIDEADDSAGVKVRVFPETSLEDVNRALAQASVGAGHEYRVQPGSWQATA
jgi:hypothetical protein